MDLTTILVWTTLVAIGASAPSRNQRSSPAWSERASPSAAEAPCEKPVTATFRSRGTTARGQEAVPLHGRRVTVRGRTGARPRTAVGPALGHGLGSAHPARLRSILFPVVTHLVIP